MTNKVGRPRKAESFRRLVAAALVEDPEISTLELLRRATAEGYDGGKSAFYELVASTRDPGRAGERRDALPGESSRHAVVEVTLPYAGGARRRARLFVSRLDFSRFVLVSLLPDNGLEAIARALVEHFARIGGVPLLATFDSLRLGAVSTEPFAHLALDLGIGIQLPQPPRTRVSSSRIARMLREELVPPLFGVRDDADLVRQIDGYTTERNARVVEELGRTPRMLLLEERRRLRPLRVSPAELTLRIPITVQPGGIVTYEDRDYVVSHVPSGTAGMLFVAPTQLRIVVGGSVTVFARFFR